MRHVLVNNQTQEEHIVMLTPEEEVRGWGGVERGRGGDDGGRGGNVVSPFTNVFSFLSFFLF